MEWAIWLTVVVTLLVFGPTRKLAFWLFVGLPLGILGLLLLCEPNLSDPPD